MLTGLGDWRLWMVKNKRLSLTGLLISLPLLCLVTLVLVTFSTASPGGIDTFDRYSREMPEPASYWRIAAGDREVLMTQGPITLITLPSGPPAYVFDRNGRLIDWTLDMGDDAKFRDAWPMKGAREIGADEARNWLTGHTP